MHTMIAADKRSDQVKHPLIVDDCGGLFLPTRDDLFKALCCLFWQVGLQLRAREWGWCSMLVLGNDRAIAVYYREKPLISDLNAIRVILYGDPSGDRWSLISQYPVCHVPLYR